MLLSGFLLHPRRRPCTVGDPWQGPRRGHGERTVGPGSFGYFHGPLCRTGHGDRTCPRAERRCGGQSAAVPSGEKDRWNKFASWPFPAGCPIPGTVPLNRSGRSLGFCSARTGHVPDNQARRPVRGSGVRTRWSGVLSPVVHRFEGTSRSAGTRPPRGAHRVVRRIRRGRLRGGRGLSLHGRSALRAGSSCHKGPHRRCGIQTHSHCCAHFHAHLFEQRKGRIEAQGP